VPNRIAQRERGGKHYSICIPGVAIVTKAATLVIVVAGTAWQGTAWRGMAGVARQGKAGQGMAWQARKESTQGERTSCGEFVSSFKATAGKQQWQH
jgi:hypothetical protein